MKIRRRRTEKSIKVFILLLFAFIQLLQTGCWNNRDLAQLSIATGIGIDKAGEGRILLTIQIVKPSSVMKKGKNGGSGEEKAVSNVTQEGDTVFEALRDILKKVNHKIFLSTVQIIIVGEDLARDGISDILDFFERDHEIQFKTNIAIAKGITAGELLEMKSETSDIPARYIAETLKNGDGRAKTIKTMLIDLSKIIEMSGKQIVIGAVSKNESKTVDAEGVAVIFADKLVGWLSPEETRGYLFAAGKVKSTIIVIQNPSFPQKKVSVEIIRSSSKLGINWENGRPVFTIKIKAEGNLADQQDGGDLTAKEPLDQCEQLLRQEIMKEVKEMLKISQEQYESDILGFGEIIHKYHLKYWRGAELNWKETYSQTPVKIDIEAKIRRSGLITRPAEPK
jgi:spore germination protein KC